MVAREDRLYSREGMGATYADLIENVSFRTQSGRDLFRFKAASGTVRSIQRLPLPKGKDAAWVLEHYKAFARHLNSGGSV